MSRIDWIDKKDLSPVIDYDRMARLLDVPTLNEMDDKYWWQCEVDDPESDEPTSSERDDCWRRYQGALESIFADLCESHDLVLERKPDELAWVIRPKVRWKYSAKSVMETVNGVGLFYFNSLQEFLDSGPYTERAAVLTHLHWLKRYYDVYGCGSVRTKMDQAMR